MLRTNYKLAWAMGNKLMKSSNVLRSDCGAHERRLLNDLLAMYNTLERPVANESEALEVKFGITLQQIIDV
ncbi:hypothetical protein PV325_010519, partial [Microctonus aethiopoides]